MQKILFINVDPDLQRTLVRVARDLKVDLTSTVRWEDARQQLVLHHYDLVCLHYDDFRVEGLESFILLDNILQKESTPGLLLVNAASARARQLSESLESLQYTLEIGNAGSSLEARLNEMIAGMLAVADAKQRQESLVHHGGGEQQSVGSREQPDHGAEIEVKLAPYRSGNLESVTLTRLLHTLRVKRLTGVLMLRQQGMARRYLFGKGHFIELKNSEYAEGAALQSAFAWSQGEYAFEERSEAVVGKTIDTMSLILAGVRKTLSRRMAMESLMPLMKTYPAIVATFWERQQARLKWPELHTLMGLCTGQQTLEVVLSQMGADVTAGFLAAYAARDTDLLYFGARSTSEPVVITYTTKDKRAGRKSTGETRAQAIQDDAERKKTKAYRAGTEERAKLEQELHHAFESIQVKTPHEVFGVWEGCGRSVVKERFYVLVKEHHPDVYGGNVSDEVKRLAQQIFMKVKDAYGELMKVEMEQSVPDPSLQQKSATRSTTATQSRDERGSVVQPRRQPIDTPLATQISMQSTTVSQGTHGFSRRNTTPIGLGREPSEAHPDLAGNSVSNKARQDKMEKLTQRATRARTSSAAGLTLPAAPGENRQDKMEKLAQRATRARTISLTGMSLPGAPGRAHTPVDKQGLPTAGIRTDIKKSDVKPTNAKSYFNEGFLLFRNKKYVEALDYLAKAHELEPEDGLYLTFYGYCLFLTDSDQKEKSEKLLSKALATKHRQAMPDAYLFMGRMLMVDNRLERAREHFEYALQLNPGSVDVQREMRLVELRIKERNEKGGFLRNLFKK